MLVIIKTNIKSIKILEPLDFTTDFAYLTDTSITLVHVYTIIQILFFQSVGRAKKSVSIYVLLLTSKQALFLEILRTYQCSIAILVVGATFLILLIQA